MPLAAGARLGAYEVLAPLGAGGMGEVYRAREPWILRAADERSSWVNYLRVDPRVAPLLDRPAIQSLVSRLGRGV